MIHVRNAHKSRLERRQIQHIGIYPLYFVGWYLLQHGILGNALLVAVNCPYRLVVLA